MSEKFEKPFTPKNEEEDAKKVVENMQKAADEELNAIQEKFNADTEALATRLRSVEAHYEAVVHAIDSLRMLSHDLHEDFIAVISRLIRMHFEVVSEPTDEEIEAEFQRNPKVTLDLRSLGIDSLHDLDQAPDEHEFKEKMLMSAITELAAKAIAHRQENVAFTNEALEIQKKFGDGLSDLLQNADFGAGDGSVEEVEQRLKQYVQAAGKVFEASKRELNDLFFNR